MAIQLGPILHVGLDGVGVRDVVRTVGERRTRPRAHVWLRTTGIQANATKMDATIAVATAMASGS